jgi:hypothetical protein
MVSAAVVAVAASFAGQAAVEELSWRRRSEARAVALVEAEAALESLVALPWAELTAARLAAERLDDNAQRRLPAATLVASVVEQTGPPAAKRLCVVIHWGNSAGTGAAGSATGPSTTAAPVELVTWVYQHGH